KLDEYGNVLYYEVLPEHPGGNRLLAQQFKTIKVPASQMLHWFKLDRPGTHRGTPDMKSTLPVGASSRRFREATVAAAETAADLAAISTTQHSPDTEPDQVAPFTGVPLPKR